MEYEVGFYSICVKADSLREALIKARQFLKEQGETLNPEYIDWESGYFHFDGPAEGNPLNPEDLPAIAPVDKNYKDAKERISGEMKVPLIKRHKEKWNELMNLLAKCPISEENKVLEEIERLLRDVEG